MSIRPTYQTSGRKPYFKGPKPIVRVLRRAAQYVRMSTDYQRYSIENQKQAIAEYALSHDIEIVRTYADGGRSGLLLKGRYALQQLISDVQQGRANFNVILVYDVIRWGRFQDADESAYYEFICKSAGVLVHYCAERFENDDSIFSTLLKGIKRAMAGEYSRELSAKVSQGHRRLAKLGFHQGGRPGFGFRRLLVDDNRRPKLPLLEGQEKNLISDRVMLVPGPENETQTIRDIFWLFVIERTPHKRIARILNEMEVLNGCGNQWSGNNVRDILSSEKYIGNFTYNRTSLRLQSKRVYHPKDKWIRIEGVMEPIVDRKIFASAQLLLNETWALSDTDLLDYLTAAWCVTGYLSSGNVHRIKCAPAINTYVARFGSLVNAYRLIGYIASHNY